MKLKFFLLATLSLALTLCLTGCQTNSDHAGGPLDGGDSSHPTGCH